MGYELDYVLFFLIAFIWITTKERKTVRLNNISQIFYKVSLFILIFLVILNLIRQISTQVTVYGTTLLVGIIIVTGIISFVFGKLK